MCLYIIFGRAGISISPLRPRLPPGANRRINQTEPPQRMFFFSRAAARASGSRRCSRDQFFIDASRRARRRRVRSFITGGRCFRGGVRVNSFAGDSVGAANAYLSRRTVNRYAAGGRRPPAADRARLDGVDMLRVIFDCTLRSSDPRFPPNERTLL
ncbi:hypothetical protein EVAR_43719_1 [Eumeta japonica]|uniref:Uncharacterized protein n=1 Tax=Eumeta variegata TaxID=151549 RepID=A0A4C1Y3R2_EUMVA|nr:hypothetical protein EVAR_43719_1 [Eumeta japonica]